MGKGKHTLEDECDIVIEGWFSLNKLLGEDSMSEPSVKRRDCGLWNCFQNGFGN